MLFRFAYLGYNFKAHTKFFIEIRKHNFFLINLGNSVALSWFIEVGSGKLSCNAYFVHFILNYL